MGGNGLCCDIALIISDNFMNVCANVVLSTPYFIMLESELKSYSFNSHLVLVDEAIISCFMAKSLFQGWVKAHRSVSSFRSCNHLKHKIG